MATRAEIDIRVQEVVELILSRHSSNEIVRICSERYSCSSRNIDKYIQRAHEVIANSLKDDIDLKAEVKKTIKRLELYASRLIMRGKEAQAASIEMNILKLKGWTEEFKHTHEHTHNDLSEVPREQLVAIARGQNDKPRTIN